MGLMNDAHWIRVDGETLYRYYQDMVIWQQTEIYPDDRVVAYLIEKVDGMGSDDRCMWNGTDGAKYPILMIVYNVPIRHYDLDTKEIIELEFQEFTDEEIEEYAMDAWREYVGHRRDNTDKIEVNYYRVR